MRMLLTGGLVYQQGSFHRCDVELDSQRIALISPNINQSGFGSVFDFNNCFILPGFVDVHVHLREPGFSYKETILSGTRAAARGGYTAVCTMPNLNPPPDSAANLKIQRDIIDNDAVIDVFPYACITIGERGEKIADIEALAPQVIGFSDDGRGVQDRGMMREAMSRVKEAGSLIAAHCEDDALINGGYIHDGVYAKLNGHRGIPSASEYKQLERDLELVRYAGCRYHICHVSTKESVELIRAAKKGGLPVTCETAPHYLLLCDDDLADDGRFKMNPPLRSALDRDALIEAVIDGTVDIIATDHAPHAESEKNRGLRDSVMGVVGLETAFRVLYTRLVLPGVIKLEMLIEKMSDMPRKIFNIGGGLTGNGNGLLGIGVDLTGNGNGLVGIGGGLTGIGGLETGQAADICVIDPYIVSKINPAEFLSMGKSTPFDGLETTGDIVMTISKGEIVWQSGSRGK